MTAVSDKPWSKFSESDYSLAEWHRACVLHMHEGEPQKKADCKLPIREPDGTMNRNGVMAAAGALAGARGGVDAPAAMKSGAARKIVAAYKDMGMTPPDSMMRMANEQMNAHIRELAKRK